MSSDIQKNISLIRLIEEGVKYWIKNQCNSIKHLDIDIDSSFYKLLKGRLKSIKAIANNINFQEILIEGISLESTPIKIKFFFHNGKLSIKVLDSFIVKGNVRITSIQLEAILNSDKWSWLKQWFCNTFKADLDFQNITIDKNCMYIKHINSSPESEVFEIICLGICNGKLELKSKSSHIMDIFPMEDGINLKSISGENNIIEIYGSAMIKPE